MVDKPKTSEPRIGVFVCCCGLNIAGVVDVKELAEYARTLPNVVLVENNLFTCSTDTQVLIAEKIKELNLNRIVVAACTPRTHEPLFQATLQVATGMPRPRAYRAAVRRTSSSKNRLTRAGRGPATMGQQWGCSRMSASCSISRGERNARRFS